MLDDPLVPVPEVGRVFRTRRRVRLGDATPSRRLRLDAVARYLQDIGNDDTADSGLDETAGPAAGLWVVRRAVVDVLVSPQWNDTLDLATWCGGVGKRWAERRLSIESVGGEGHMEINTLWVHVNPRSGLPAPLPERFVELYGEAALGRAVGANKWLTGGPDDDAPIERIHWPLRAVDYDMLGHVNNAAYWEAVEQVLSLNRDHPVHPARGRTRAVLEFGGGIARDAHVDLLVARTDKQIDLWFEADGQRAASARMILPSLPPAANRS